VRGNARHWQSLTPWVTKYGNYSLSVVFACVPSCGDDPDGIFACPSHSADHRAQRLMFFLDMAQ
jgi:hypothetical protein